MNTLKITKLLLVTLFMISHLNAQLPHNHSMCGHGPTATQKVNAEEMELAFKQGKTIVADRFGNTYVSDNLKVAKNKAPANTSINCDGGHFTLFFVEGWNDNNADDVAMQELVCNVFSYLSGFIQSNAINPEINIRVDKKTLGGGALGLGTPYWNINIPDLNKKMGNFVIPNILAGHPFQSNDGYHGLMQIDDQTNWLIDDTPETESEIVGTGKKDLYTVVLHEALHILGFASRIHAGGQPLPLNNTDPYAFYSEWDKYLRNTQNGTTLPLIEINEDMNYEYCVEYQYTHPISPENLLQDNCGEMGFDFNGTNNLTVNPESVGALYNSLSHFTNNCSSDNFVMHPYLANEAVRRIVTDTEKQALCNIGYNITDVCMTTDEYCSLVLENDLLVVESNELLTLTLNEILSNDILEGIGSIDNINITYNFGCGNVSGLSINGTGTLNDPFSIFTLTEGDYNFCYTIEDCDGGCVDGNIFIKVVNLDVSGYDRCDELNNNDCRVFYDDFEYPNPDVLLWQTYAVNSDGFFGAENLGFLIDNSVGNSPDLKISNSNNISFYNFCDEFGQTHNPQITNLSSYIHLYAFNESSGPWIEGAIFDLCSPIYPDDMVEVNFLGAGLHQCSDAILNVAFTNEDAVNNEIINGLILDEQQISLSPINPINETILINVPYSLNFNNTGTAPWNHILLEKVLEPFRSRVYIDDLEVLRLRDLQIQGETLVQACPEEIEIQYEITDYRSDFLVNIAGIPTDVNLIPTASVPSTNFTISEGTYHPENETFSAILTIRLDIPDTYPNGSTFNIMVSTSDPTGNACGTMDQSLTATVQIQQNPITIEGIYHEDNNNVQVEICNSSNITQITDVIISLPPEIDVQDALVFNTSSNNVGGTILSAEGLLIPANDCLDYALPVNLTGSIDCSDVLSFHATGSAICGETIDIFSTCEELIYGSVTQVCEDDHAYGAQVLIDADGTYCNTLVDAYANYECTYHPNANEIFVNSANIDVEADCGVTTYDIVLTSKHILNVLPFTSPYQLIATDVNSSESVTTADLVEMRKIVLHVNQSWPNDDHDDKYKFVNEASLVSTTTQYPTYEETINLDTYDAPYDFKAVKIGDANCSSGWGLCNPDPYANLFTLNTSITMNGGIVELKLAPASNVIVDGFQFSIGYDSSSLEELDIIGSPALQNFTKDNYNYISKAIGIGEAMVSWTGDVSQGNLLPAGAPFLTLRFSKKKIINDISNLFTFQNSVIQNMMIAHDNKILKPSFKIPKSPTASLFTVAQPFNVKKKNITEKVPVLYPNPAKDIVTIQSVEVSRVEIYNMGGKLLKSQENSNEIHFDGLASGIYFIKIIDTEGNLTTQKLIISK